MGGFTPATSEPYALASGALRVRCVRCVEHPRLAPAAHLREISQLKFTGQRWVMHDVITSLITWTAYGTWLPGDDRGWRKRKSGPQVPQPLLEEWCRKQMNGHVVLLESHDRHTVERACHQHCDHRGWSLLAVNARKNHVHVVVAAGASPIKVRDQLKANCTSALRRQARALLANRTWTKGGDCEILDTDEEIHGAVVYVTEAQDRQNSERFR